MNFHFQIEYHRVVSGQKPHRGGGREELVKKPGLTSLVFQFKMEAGGGAETKSQPKTIGFSLYPRKLAHIQRVFTPWYPVSSSSKTGNAISGVLHFFDAIRKHWIHFNPASSLLNDQEALIVALNSSPQDFFQFLEIDSSASIIICFKPKGSLALIFPPLLPHENS